MENANWASLVRHKSQPVFHVLVSHLENLYSYDEYNWFTKSTNDTEQYEHKNYLLYFLEICRIWKLDCNFFKNCVSWH